MRDLPTDDLLRRAGDLMTAMLVYTSEGKIGIEPIEGDLSKMERFAHVLEELALRGVDYRQPAVLEALNMPKPPKVRRALQALAGRSWPQPILVKFGKRQHMAALLHEGKGRVSPAGFYHDPSLGRARTDKEGRLRSYVHPIDAHRFMGVRQDGEGTRAVDIDVPYLGSAEIELYALSDFYVYCMTESYDARLFEDFDDTCVVITRPAEFTSRLQHAIESSLPGWKFYSAPVVYFDPFFSRPHQMAFQTSAMTT